MLLYAAAAREVRSDIEDEPMYLHDYCRPGIVETPAAIGEKAEMCSLRVKLMT
jgi:hypothetical protein